MRLLLLLQKRLHNKQRNGCRQYAQIAKAHDIFSEKDRFVDILIEFKI